MYLEGIFSFFDESESSKDLSSCDQKKKPLNSKKLKVDVNKAIITDKTSKNALQEIRKKENFQADDQTEAKKTTPIPLERKGIASPPPKIRPSTVKLLENTSSSSSSSFVKAEDESDSSDEDINPSDPLNGLLRLVLKIDPLKKEKVLSVSEDNYIAHQIGEIVLLADQIAHITSIVHDPSLKEYNVTLQLFENESELEDHFRKYHQSKADGKLSRHHIAQLAALVYVMPPLYVRTKNYVETLMNNQRKLKAEYRAYEAMRYDQMTRQVVDVLLKQERLLNEGMTALEKLEKARKFY